MPVVVLRRCVHMLSRRLPFPQVAFVRNNLQKNIQQQNIHSLRRRSLIDGLFLNYLSVITFTNVPLICTELLPPQLLDILFGEWGNDETLRTNTIDRRVCYR